MPQIILNGEKLNLKRRSYQGMKLFQVEWPDHSLDFLYLSAKNKKKVWATMTILPRKTVNMLGTQIKETYKLKYYG